MSKYCCKKSKLSNINLKFKNENYKIEPNFYEALSQKIRDVLLEREDALDTNFGISRLTLKQEYQFSKAQSAEKMIMG